MIERHRRNWFFEPLMPLAFDLILIDVPTKFETWGEAGEEKSPQAQYPTMEWDEIYSLPVGDLARGDCLLLSWAQFTLLDEHMHAIKRWGFKYVTGLVWAKQTKNGKRSMGTGYRVRSMAEPLLFATVGNPLQSRAFDGLIPGERRQHSRKPESIYAAIDRCCAGLTFRADIFGRQSRPGWQVWGNEAKKFDPDGIQEPLIRPQRAPAPARMADHPELFPAETAST